MHGQSPSQAEALARAADLVSPGNQAVTRRQRIGVSMYFAGCAQGGRVPARG